jgi:hypothetical protein
MTGFTGFSGLAGFLSCKIERAVLSPHPLAATNDPQAGNYFWQAL